MSHICTDKKAKPLAWTTVPYCTLFTKGLLVLLLPILAALAATNGQAHDDSMPGNGQVPLHARDVMRAFADEHHHTESLAAQAITACVGGFAGPYPCSNVDLMAFLPLADLKPPSDPDHPNPSTGNGNDIWGWTDPATGHEYAIMGLTNGTAFVDVTDPFNPVYLGHLYPPAGVPSSSWRDIKVYADHAFIGSEALGSGLQVMDLSQLRDVLSPPVVFTQTTHYTGFSTSHNIVINENTAYAYAVGTNSGNCGRGLHFVDLLDPANPQAAGCFGADGYTHDAQCVLYQGPDNDYQDKEICFAYNEDTLTIVEVSDKAAPVQISRTGYAPRGYTHQGWLTEDQTHLLMDDELDERNFTSVSSTRTLIWDVSNLDEPLYQGDYNGVATSIDHNQYIKGNYSYQANYRSGLRVLDISDIASGNLVEVGFFDIYPSDDADSFNGAWSVYPFFDSGTVVVSGIEQGLYILLPNLGPPTDPPQVSFDNPPDGSVGLSGNIPLKIDATDTEDPAGTLDVDWNVDGGPWQNAVYANGFYVADWDSGSVLNGSHTLHARAVDNDLREGSASSSVTVANVLPEFVLSSVKVTIATGKGSRNTGQATVKVIDSYGPLAGVLVAGGFSGGWSGGGSDTTNSDGEVLLSTPTIKNLTELQFCVASAAKTGWTFNSADSTLCGDTGGGGGGSAFGSIDGVVTDALTAQIIIGAVVVTDSGESGTTDSSGNYAIANVPVGNRTVAVTANGYTGQNQTVTVSESTTSTVNFALSPAGAGSIRGTVYGGGGVKLSNVLIEVQEGPSATTNKGGKYSIQNVAEGTKTVTASKAGFQTQTKQVTVSAGLTATVDFTLLP